MELLFYFVILLIAKFCTYDNWTRLELSSLEYKEAVYVSQINVLSLYIYIFIYV